MRICVQHINAVIVELTQLILIINEQFFQYINCFDQCNYYWLYSVALFF